MSFHYRMICASFIILILLYFLGNSESAHIVFIHHIASYSHRIASAPLAEKLILRGHNVTYITSTPLKIPNPNITDIIPRRVQAFMEEMLRTDHGVKARLHGIPLPFIGMADIINVKVCQELLQSEELKSWLSTSPQVHLIYVDTFPECAYGLAYKLKAKVAIFTPFPLLGRVYDQLGIPDEASSIPVIDYRTYKLDSLFERTRNALTVIAWHFSNVISTMWMERTLRDYLEIPDMPSLEDMHKNLSLVLMNGHFIDEHPRSLPPFVISVPGLHVKETHKPLPQHLEQIIGSADSTSGLPSEGFVLISLGTVVDTQTLPQNIREAFFNAIKSFPNLRFLWRWNGVFPVDGPNNLHFSNWFEQQDVLGHPKIRAFIFQAGRPSAQEALCNAVPMITFPILADQDYTANRLQDLGVSINLEIGSTTAEQLQTALSDVMYDQRFKKKSLKMAKLFKDLPMKPIETSVWWTEYILRHDDTLHLKPEGRNQTWYQRRLLDVWIFVAMIFICSSYLTLIIVRSIFRKITQKKLLNKSKAS